MPSYIPDGYTFKAIINPEEMQHDGLEFKFRPAVPSETAKYYDELEDLDSEALRDRQSEFIINKVSWWNLEKPDGSSADISKQVLLNNLHNNLFQKMFGIVMGWDKPDAGEACDMKELAGN